jgi:hypothetical protein
LLSGKISDVPRREIQFVVGAGLQAAAAASLKSNQRVRYSRQC